MKSERALVYLTESLRDDSVSERLLASLELDNDANPHRQLYVATGFLPGLSVGKSQLKNFSRVFDDLGSCFNVQTPTCLEKILNNESESLFGKSSDDSLHARARDCINLIIQQQLSLVDHDLRQLSSEQIKSTEVFSQSRDLVKRIVVFDQPEGDPLVTNAQSSATDFSAMLRAARNDHTEAEIFLKLAHDNHGNTCPGYCDLSLARELGITIIDENINTIELIQSMDAVYVANSLHGLEAMLCKKPVYCFLPSFYGGWGLTHDADHLVYARRHRPHTIESLFAGIFLIYSHYLNPVSREPCELEELLSFLLLQKQIYRSNEYHNICVGFPPWKRAYVKRALFSPNGKTKFFSSSKKAARYIKDQGSNSHVKGSNAPLRLVQWGEVESAGIAAVSEQTGVRVLRMEDGFVRSVGLGKYYIPPLSIVADSTGIYYNAQRASDLERFLSEKNFSETDKVRSGNIIQQLNKNRITKYNVGAMQVPADIQGAVDQFRKVNAECEDARVALVVGQVADDVSVKLGGARVRTDLELLAAVRQKRPSVLLLYKPHPDVVSGNVAKNDANVLQLSEAKKLADLTVSEVDMDVCLQSVDELHCNTSLAGFEALLRGKTVYVYGKPFYAGWGLTIDDVNIERRNRVLSLNELVHGVLVDYPRYIDYETGYFITIEQALARIGNIMQSSLKTKTIYSSKIGRVIRKVRNLFGSLIYGLRF